MVKSARLDPYGQDRVLLDCRENVSHAATRFRWAAGQLLSELGSRHFPELRKDPLRTTDEGRPTDGMLQLLLRDPHFPIPEQFPSAEGFLRPICDECFCNPCYCEHCPPCGRF